ncbi:MULTISPECIES: DUF4365 domain-containing protein [unclassified Oceanispirochaeta]|uniref:DUF4365 domain-containing protein n=1 Tax=unclassified Oceanispirochaeta TaxID=2635722 RepID=UPI000E08F132|nr:MULTISPECIES: DUF4365 domain-containing protein [unclassified Oceanispirochaeta]MBF9018635.1 DUF4365 domain-containing protein [Oceanispirochaeta sp. M2]NPD75072.1 DUF4365 domain-containing protein [Oceanispirochaeta sp. M1]RDG29098.1 DUF4365 domain-containing protein [Oceanispirochaeta sp. M1]
MSFAKRKTESQVTGERAVEIVKEKLPSEWTIRELNPDYGIDLEIEPFEEIKIDQVGHYQTLGEHLYIQVKGTKSIVKRTIPIHERSNVERLPIPERVLPQTKYGELEVLTFNLEMSEIFTIHRMGSGVPVLLFLVDIVSENIYFICINDYIDKILLPEFGLDVFDQGSKTIYIPIENMIDNSSTSHSPIKWYAKRAKYYSAFLKFSYQKTNLEYSISYFDEAKYQATKLLMLDIWYQENEWRPINSLYSDLKTLAETGTLNKFNGNYSDDDCIWEIPELGNRLYSRQGFDIFTSIKMLWNQLSNLGAVYEDTCREWNLPSYMGMVTAGK